MDTFEFINRTRELASLERWYAETPAGALGIVWGRRRIGKSELLRRFATAHRSVFHVSARRPMAAELQLLAEAAAPHLDTAFRDLAARPFVDWTDALESFAQAAQSEPLLLILDELPELVDVVPELPSILRAVWDRVRHHTRLRLLLCGSAVRTMEAMQEQREPLYGRFDLSLLVSPLRPHEAALMLPALPPAERARVWGLTGGVPQYLAWWDTSRPFSDNLLSLVCTPGGRMLLEGELVMATEGSQGDLTAQVLYAIASGSHRFGEIKDAVRTDPTRTLERLRALHLVERVLPITEDERSSRRRTYRIADNFLAFWLGIASRHRSAIDLGLGASLLPIIERELDDFMGARWEEAFRLHLARLADQGALGPEVAAIGSFWRLGDVDGEPDGFDAVVLSGRERAATLIGEAKWSKHVDAHRVLPRLERKARSLPRLGDPIRYAIAAREAVDNAGDALAITAADIFGTPVDTPS